jgi:hypothetical protein
MNSAKLKARELRNKLKKERDKENNKIESNDNNLNELNKKMNYSSSMPFLQVDNNNNNNDNEEFDPLKYFENKKIHITPKKLNLKNLYNEEDSNLNEKNYHRKLNSVSLPFNRNDFKLDLNEILNAKKNLKNKFNELDNEIKLNNNNNININKNDIDNEKINLIETRLKNNIKFKNINLYKNNLNNLSIYNEILNKSKELQEKINMPQILLSEIKDLINLLNFNNNGKYIFDEDVGDLIENNEQQYNQIKSININDINEIMMN